MWENRRINDTFIKYKSDIIIITIVALLASAFRLINLDNWPRYYVDEGTYGMVNYNVYRGIWGLEDINPQFFPYLPSIMTGFLPYIFGRDYFTIRFPNAIAGVISCLILYFIGKKLYNRQIGAVAAILMAISFTTVYINRLAMKDNIMQLFWMLSVFFYILLLNQNKNLWKYFLGISLGFAFISKYSALAAVLFIVLHSLLTKKIRLILLPLLIFILIAATLPLIGIIYDKDTFISEMIHQSVVYKNNDGNFYTMLNVLVLGIPTDQLHWGIYYANIWTTLGFLSLLYLAGRKGESHGILLTWAVSIFVVYIVFIPSYWIYLLPLTPIYYLATANLLLDIKNKRENSFFLIILIALIFLPEFYFKRLPLKLIPLSQEYFLAIFIVVFSAILVKNYSDGFRRIDIPKSRLEYISIIIILFFFVAHVFYIFSIINSNEVADQKSIAEFINANTRPNEIVASAAPITYLLVNSTPVEYEHVLFYTTKEPTILLEPMHLSKFKLDVTLDKVKFFVDDTPWNFIDEGKKITPTITQEWIKEYISGDYRVYLNPDFKVEKLIEKQDINSIPQNTSEKIIWVPSSIPRLATNDSEINILNNSFKLSLASSNNDNIYLSMESKNNFNTSSILYLNQTFLQPNSATNYAYDFKIIFDNNNQLIAHYIGKAKSQYFEIGKIIDGVWYPQYYKQKMPPIKVDWKIKITPEKYIFYENERKLVEEKNSFGNASFKPSFSLTTNDAILKTWEINRIEIKNLEKNTNISDIQLADISQLPQLGEIIEKSGFAVKLLEFSNLGSVSLIKLSAANLENKEKSFDLEPSPVLIDDLGNQYDMVKIERSSQIEQNAIYPGVIRKGAIFFKPINPNAKYLRLILYLNGEKFEFGMKAESKILQDDGIFSNISAKIAANSTMGDTITQDGFAVMLKSFHNTQDWTSQVNIAVKNMENEDKPFNLNPTPALIDDLGNQYGMTKIERGSQITQTNIYPGVVRKGAIFFKPINSNAKLLKLILYINDEKYEFGFKPIENTSTYDSFSDNISAINAINSTDIIKTVTKEGFIVKINGFYNSPGWVTKVLLTAKNIDAEEKLFDLNPAPVIIDDLDNQYEMVKIEGSTQIESSAVYPSAERKGVIFFEPVDPKAKLIKLILYINGEKYEFVFEPYNLS